MKKLLTICAAITSLIGTLLPFSPAIAQNFAPGQAVEVDITAMNSWEPGTVVPFLPEDKQDGYLVRVKVPHYTLYPDGMLVQKIHMRPAAAPPPVQKAAVAAQNNQGNAAVNNATPAWTTVAHPPANHPGNAPQANGNTGFRPGDRVEIDKAHINSWEGATVLPYMDNDQRDGMVRIRIDNYTITPHGMLVPAERLRAATGGAAAARKTPSFNIGDKVDARSNWQWHNATVVEKRGIDEYKVHYEGWDAKWDEWVDPSRIAAAGKGVGPRASARAAGNPQGGNGAAGAGAAATGDRGMTPQLNNGIPLIPGTGWNMLSIGKRGENPTTAKSAYQTFSFSKDGRWSITHYSLAAGQIGTYKVQGNHLVMTNNLDGNVSNYTMNWKANENIMELDDGKWVLRMQLCSKNAYGEK